MAVERPSYSELTAFNGKTRILGLNNSVFNTNDLVEAELSMLSSEISPTETKKKNLENELAIWKEFKTKYQDVANTFRDIRFYDFNTKKSTYSNEGVVTLTSGKSAVSGQYDVTVTQLATNHQVAGNKHDDVEAALNLEGTFKLGDKELAVTNDMSLRDVVKKINDGNYGASAAIIANRLVITSNETGEENALKFEDGPNGVLKQMGILNEDGGVRQALSTPQNAVYSINGIESSSSSNIITNGIDGSELTLQREGTTKVSVASDTKVLEEKLDGFVKAYNNAIKMYNDYTGEETYLQGQSVTLMMRRALSDITNFVSQDGVRSYELGIEIDGIAKDGRLTFNKETLKKNFEENPEKITNAFFGEQGIAKYMEDKLNTYVSATGVLQNKIDGMSDSIKKLNDEITKFDDLYEIRSQSIIKKYADFETRMSNLNFQLEYMEAQIESMNSNNK